MNPARFAREIPHRYRLEAAKCRGCGETYFPHRLICRKCGNRQFETVKISSHGKLETFTVIHTPASAFKDQSPFALGVCRFPEGVRITAQIVDIDLDKIKLGMQLPVEFRRVQTDGHAGIVFYGYKFVPVI
jgi:hypothetical protein